MKINKILQHVKMGLEWGGGRVLCYDDVAAHLPICFHFFFFLHLGVPCKSIQLYYFVIVFHEFCISKLLSIF